MRHALTAIALCVLSSSVAAKPLLRFEKNAVVAAEVREGSTVVWFGYTFQTRGYSVRTIEYTYAVTDDDRDGVVRLEVIEGVAPRSVWVAVELASGDVEIGSPDPEGFRKRHFGNGIVKKGDGPARFRETAEHLTFLFVRPGVGAWTAASFDGAAGDPDQQSDGFVGAVLSAMKPVAGNVAAPIDVQRDDRLLAISPDSGAVFDVRFAQ